MTDLIHLINTKKAQTSSGLQLPFPQRNPGETMIVLRGYSPQSTHVQKPIAGATMYQLRLTILLSLSAAVLYVSPAQTVETLTATLNASGGVSVDARGDIYVADFGTTLGNANGTTVYKVLRDGSFSVFATGLQGASGNDFNSEGYLIQSNIAGGKVSKIDTAGNVEDFADANIFSPVGVSVGNGDTVFIADCRSNPGTIVRITPDGTSTIFASSNLLNCANGLTRDDEGNLYSCNFNNGWVTKITPDGSVANFAEIPGGRNGHLEYANGRLYVAGRCVNQIYEVTLDGTVTLLAGSGARGNDDGDALDATFNLPNGIAASADGDTLFINDAVSLNGDCVTTLLNPVVVRMITGVKQTVAVASPVNAVPSGYSLGQNYPNPFNPETEIRFALPETASVSIVLYDLLGREAETLVRGEFGAGEHRVRFDATGLAGGAYTYRIVAQSPNGEFTDSRKLVLLK